MHTKGPWSINEYPQPDTSISIGAESTPLIARVMLRDVSINEQKANAHHIVACVNEHDQLKSQRDALLHAAQNLRNVKGRFHTEKAMEQLLFVLNQVEEQMKC